MWLFPWSQHVIPALGLDRDGGRSLGQITQTQAELIVQAATSVTERKWIKFALTHTTRWLQEAVLAARSRDIWPPADQGSGGTQTAQVRRSPLAYAMILDEQMSANEAADDGDEESLELDSEVNEDPVVATVRIWLPVEMDSCHRPWLGRLSTKYGVSVAGGLLHRAWGIKYFVTDSPVVDTSEERFWKLPRVPTWLLGSFLIIVLLAVVLVPNFVRVDRGVGPLTYCKTNLKNLGVALEIYAGDNQGFYPSALSSVTSNYLKTIPTCPGAHRDTYSSSYVVTKEVTAGEMKYTLCCSGAWHADSGLGPNYPQFTATRGLISR